MHPNIIEAIEYMTNRGISTQISTNGLLLTPELAENLYKAGQKEIIVALDTLIPKAYQKIRGSIQQYNTVVNNISEVLNKTEMKIKIQFMPTKYNQGEPKENFFLKFGNKNLSILDWFVVRFTDAENVSIDLTHGAEDIDKRGCDKLYERVIVLWNGITLLCCVDMNGELITGDLNTNTIEESYSGEKAQIWRTKIVSGDYPAMCKTCLGDSIVINKGREFLKK